MKRKTALTLSIVAALAAGSAGAALAHGNFGAQGPRDGQMGQGQMGGGMMQGQGGGMRGQMMQMMRMMQGHGGMGGGAMGYMKKLLDTNDDGKITPEEARAALEALLAEYDANGDGTLSIDEFETLHSTVIRERMVDRFQKLDADGDGKITAEEMTAPVERFSRFMGEHGGEMGGGMMGHDQDNMGHDQDGDQSN